MEECDVTQLLRKTMPCVGSLKGCRVVGVASGVVSKPKREGCKHSTGCSA